MLTRVVGLAVLVLASLAMPAGAATINVNTDLDTGENGPPCSLREAVQTANLNITGVGLGCNGDTAGADTIQLTAGHVYRLTNTFAHEDNNVYGDLDIEGPTTISSSGGMATIAGKLTGDRDRVIHVESAAGSVTLERVKIQDGFLASGVGGGGILAGAPLTIIDSEITGNRVQVPNASTQGGGIFVRGPLGTLTMTGSTVAGNVSQVQGAAGSGIQALGGGISVYDGAPSVSITNSTISGNTAQGVSGVGPGLVGGAFFGDGSSAANQIPTTLTNNTITGNVATVGGALTGGIQIVKGTMTGNIVAGNTADFDPQDCSGSPTSSGGANVIGIADNFGCNLTGPGDLTGAPGTPVNAALGNLVNNGGLTRTHAPSQASPAINRGGSCPATDQRGRFRFNVLPCDSGSVELGASTTPPPPPPPPPAPPAVITTVAETGQRAAALAKCKKKKTKKKRKKCRKKAQLLPV